MIIAVLGRDGAGPRPSLNARERRELYRQLPDYRDRLGAFEWKLDEDMHPDVFVGDMATWWIKNHPKTELSNSLWSKS